MTAKKKPATSSRRERTIHETRGTISDMIGRGGRSSEYDALDDEMDSLDRAAKQSSSMIEQKVAAAYKIKKMEQSGMFTKEQIDQAKKDLGIFAEGTTQTSGTDHTYNMLSTQIANEPDADVRERLTQQMMIMDVYRDMKGRPAHEIQSAVNNLKTGFMQNVQKKDNKSEDFMNKMAGKFMDKLMETPKSELDNLDKLTSLIEKVQKLTPQTDGLKEIAANVKSYKEMGFIKDSATTLEEKKLEIEKLKVDKEYELREKEISNEADRTKSLTGVAGDVLSSVFDAVGQSTSKSAPGQRTTPPVRTETLQNAMNATCVTPDCGAKILVTNVDQSREISCSGCNQKYLFDADKKKLFLVEAEQPGTGKSPVPPSTQDSSQSTTA